MATLLLAAAGSAIGGAFGGTILGISGAVIGQSIGAMIGRSIDQSLFGPTQKVTGPRLDSVEVQTSKEGDPLAVVDGRGRVAGSVIWATRLDEVTKTSSSGGKGGGPKVSSTEYSYFANFAVALTDCTGGPVRHFGRIWADGKLLDVAGLTIRFYNGSETQTPDPLIVAKDGAAPAYRGTSYIVFENMPVGDYGRRIPTLTFEVWGPAGEMEDLIQGVDLIPAATEFGYSPSVVTVKHQPNPGDLFKKGETLRENAIRNNRDSDWSLSLDLLAGTLPACQTVALVVSWFGTDLRAGSCEFEPRVEVKGKITSNVWSVAGLTRAAANLVSYIDGKPAFGSTPDDKSVIDAIQDLKARGFRVLLYPFLMMDIPAENTPPTRDGGVGQPVYPWRGRIGPTLGAGSVASQIAAMVGTAAPGHYSSGTGVPHYSGPDEWSFRRFILHLAALARNAGGVDAFLIGSELVDLTTATDTPAAYPFVDALVSIAADVKAMLPAAAVSYAADWSEYHSHRNGSDVFFHLDSLWSSPNVDFVGIDNYLPISDWRPGTGHLDYNPDTGATSPYSLTYLKGNIEGGEFWDFYYASPADRDAQIRTPIQDGAYGEDWVFRQKAIRDWWSNTHHNRPDGVRSASATSWVPASKPLWFTEFGCPAVDLAANQPNVFFDENSSEAALPYYSSGNRDDFAQRQYLRAMIEFWRDNGGSMIQPSEMLAWCWDARPWPEFPRETETWSDGPNWRRGHWLNGRAGAAPAAEVIQRRLETYYGYTPADVDLSRCYGQADGAIIPGPLTFREMLATWETALRLDASEFGGVFQVVARAAARPVASLGLDNLVEDGESALYTITRTSQEETPRRAVVRYSDTDRDYQTGAAIATIRSNPGQAEAEADLALVSDLDRMTATAETILRSAADTRETVELTLPPSSNLRPGDVFTLTPKSGRPIRFIADQITRGAARKVRASLYSDSMFGSIPGPVRPTLSRISPASETALAYLMDLPLLPGVTMEDHQGLAAFLSTPWPGGVDLYRSAETETGFTLNMRTGLSGSAGETTATLAPGVTGRWSGETLEVTLFSGALVSRSESDVLEGANSVAVEHAPGDWEILQFRDATLIGALSWRLSGLLRGQLGTEWVRDPGGLAAGARVVVLDSGVSPVSMLATDISRPFCWRATPIARDQTTAETVAHTFQGVARRPFSPVHLAATLAGSSLSLTWIRRTRVEGDPWLDSGDVPLGEAFERYLVEVGPEGAPILSDTVSTSAATLAVGAISGTQEVRVYQVSETYGPGIPARLDVNF